MNINSKRKVLSNLYLFIYLFVSLFWRKAMYALSPKKL